jgi:hypothetical protein
MIGNIFLCELGREKASGETEQERERETDHCCERVVAWVVNLTVGVVIYEGKRRDKPGSYQDGNQAYPKYF